MARDVRAIEGDMASAADSLRSLYAKALIESDASELVATQLDFFRDNMALMSGRLFGEPRKEGRASCT
jgi:hypothetical protein